MRTRRNVRRWVDHRLHTPRGGHPRGGRCIPRTVSSISCQRPGRLRVPSRPASRFVAVDEAGAAIRPTWPTAPCGLQEKPHAALSQLHEISRAQHPVDGISSDDAGTCAESIGQPFATTTEADMSRMAEHEDTHARPLTETALATPISDVGRLRVCRYSTEPPLPESRIRLSRQQSTDLMEVASTAPPAGPCDLVAHHIASIDVLRPDGSGGTRMAVELDGCQRVNLLGQRQLPPAVIALLLQ